MPRGYKERATEKAGPWKVLRVFRLDPYDLVASKLRRFWPKDRADVRLLCDLVELEPERLEQILEEAYPFNLEKDGDESAANDLAAPGPDDTSHASPPATSH